MSLSEEKDVKSDDEKKELAKEIAKQWLINPDLLKDLDKSLKEKPKKW